jgi:hypothetical protein
MPYWGPKYPVINSNPTMDDCIKALRFRDYVEAGTVTGACWVYGFVFGKPVRFNSAHVASVIGFTAGCMLCIINARNRFMGASENAREVKLYGIDPNAQPIVHPPQDPRFPTAIPYPPSRIDWKSYK